MKKPKEIRHVIAPKLHDFLSEGFKIYAAIRSDNAYPLLPALKKLADQFNALINETQKIEA